MTTRKLSPGQAQFAAVLGPLDGARIPGGCDDCDAYQTVEPVAPRRVVDRCPPRRLVPVPPRCRGGETMTATPEPVAVRFGLSRAFAELYDPTFNPGGAADGRVTTVEPADPAPCEVCGRTCRACTDGRHVHPVCVIASGVAQRPPTRSTAGTPPPGVIP